MFYGVYAANAQQVVHQRAGAAASRRGANLHVANHLGYVGYGQKIGGELQLVNGH